MSLDHRMPYVGKFLLESGKITWAQLEEALKRQKKNNTKTEYLGQILLELGYTTEEAISEALAAQAGLPFISLEDYPIDEAAVTLLDAEIIKKYQALPVGFESGCLVIAMAQPKNIIAIDDLRIITGLEIKPVIVMNRELNASINKCLRNKLQQEVITTEENTEKPAVKLANMVFDHAVRVNASDVHIEPQEKKLRIRFRVDGVLHEFMHPPKRLHASLVSRIKVMANMDIAERRIPQDGRFTIEVEEKTIDIRVASLPTDYGEKLTLRILDRIARITTLQELGFPREQLLKFNETFNLPYGLILVTGPTGSGKSTTLYSMLNTLNVTDKHIITLEDPIERRLDGINQIQVTNQAGITFAAGLRSILRNDPDIVMVGEIRDHETARIAIETSLTGHLVLSTLHTRDSAGAITRLHDMGIEPYLTASSLVCVLAQRLARILCPNCKSPYDITRKELLQSVVDFPVAEEEKVIRLFKPKSCVECNDTGYKGRTGIFEFLIFSDSICKLTLERQSNQEIKKAAVTEGMITLRQHGLMKVKEGTTSLEEVLRVIV